MLAASRFTSHSQGAGSVSSKSFISKTRFLSGVAYNPKFIKWQSPQHCTSTPDTGVLAKSLAITIADPLKNANGDSNILAYLIGNNSSTLSLFDSMSSATGSFLFAGL